MEIQILKSKQKLTPSPYTITRIRSQFVTKFTKGIFEFLYDIRLSIFAEKQNCCNVSCTTFMDFSPKKAKS